MMWVIAQFQCFQNCTDGPYGKATTFSFLEVRHKIWAVANYISWERMMDAIATATFIYLF